MSDRATPETTESDDADDTEIPDPEDIDTSHLDGIDDGCGCAEVWEHLSEERDD